MWGLFDIILPDRSRKRGVADETGTDAAAGAPPETVTGDLLDLEVLTRWAFDDTLAGLEGTLGGKCTDVGLLLGIELTIELVGGEIAAAN